MDAHLKREREGIVLEIISEQTVHQSSNFPKDDIADLNANYDGASPYHVNYCGFEACRPGYAFGPHSRTSYLLHIVYSGKGRYFVDNRVYDLSPGQMFLIYPGVTTTYQADFDDPWSYGWIGFSGHRSETVLSQVGFSPENHVISIEADIQPLRDCIQRMLETHKLTLANELYRTSELLHLFGYITEHSSRANSASPGYSKAVYAQLAMRYMESNYRGKVKISALADYIGIDRSYLTRSFREEYHVSPQEYLIRLRIEQAEKLLAQTSAPISVIATQVGYPDALAFSKIFHQRKGISPTEYRNLEGKTDPL